LGGGGGPFGFGVVLLPVAGCFGSAAVAFAGDGDIAVAGDVCFAVGAM